VYGFGMAMSPVGSYLSLAGAGACAVGGAEVGPVGRVGGTAPLGCGVASGDPSGSTEVPERFGGGIL
jgi:hypothetical protein